MTLASILAVTHPAIVAGSTIEEAARAAFPVRVKKGATLDTLVDSILDGCVMRDAVAAAQLADGAALRTILADLGYNVDDRKAVADSVRAYVWKRNKLAQPAAGAPKPAEGTQELKDYNKVATQIRRVVDCVCGPTAKAVAKEAAQAVPTKAERAMRKAMAALVAEFGVSLGRKAYATAVADAFAAAK